MALALLKNLSRGGERQKNLTRIHKQSFWYQLVLIACRYWGVHAFIKEMHGARIFSFFFFSFRPISCFNEISTSRFA